VQTENSNPVNSCKNTATLKQAHAQGIIHKCLDFSDKIRFLAYLSYMLNKLKCKGVTVCIEIIHTHTRTHT
jgi:hypothetical protein